MLFRYRELSLICAHSLCIGGLIITVPTWLSRAHADIQSYTAHAWRPNLISPHVGQRTCLERPTEMSDIIIDQKSVLRAEARRHRKGIDTLCEDPEDAGKLFFDALSPSKDKIIAAYYPVGKEFDALSILEMALSRGYGCALPRIEKDSRILRFYNWNQATDMQDNQYAIPEPSGGNAVDPDIIIVPLLSFDRRGMRLGQGGGYYDATLNALRARKDIVAVGMAHSQQAVLFNLPCEDHDEKLDWVITPKSTHYFGD